MRKKEFDFEPTTLGEHVRRERLKRGLTQKEAAKLLGVNPWTVLNWETGVTTPPIRSIPAILVFLGYDPDAIPATTLPDRLRAKRRELGLSRKRMAQRLGIDETTLRDWEAGKLVLFKRHRKLIAAILGLSEQMFEREMAECCHIQTLCGGFALLDPNKRSKGWG